MVVKVVAGGQSLTGVELAAFAGDECRTAATTDNEGVAYLVIPGDEPCTLTFKVAVGNEVADAPLTLTYETDAIYGTPKQPVEINLGDANGIREILYDNGIESIYDLSGRKMVNGQWPMVNGRKGVYIINGQKKTVK